MELTGTVVDNCGDDLGKFQLNTLLFVQKPQKSGVTCSLYHPNSEEHRVIAYFMDPMEH